MGLYVRASISRQETALEGRGWDQRWPWMTLYHQRVYAATQGAWRCPMWRWPVQPIEFRARYCRCFREAAHLYRLHLRKLLDHSQSSEESVVVDIAFARNIKTFASFDKSVQKASLEEKHTRATNDTSLRRWLTSLSSLIMYLPLKGRPSSEKFVFLQKYTPLLCLIIVMIQRNGQFFFQAFESVQKYFKIW